MKKGKYLSDVLDVHQFAPRVLNVVCAPCGCGKTTCAINHIASLASSPRRALYLIDTRNGCQRLSQEEQLTTPYQYYEDDIAGRFFSSELPDKVVVTTYAKFGMWVSKYPNFTDHFEIIICDEAHNLVQFATFSAEPNYASLARNAIRDAAILGKTIVVAITATPDFLAHLPCPQTIIPIDTASLRQYEEYNTVHYASIQQLLRRLPVGKVGGLYAARVGQMQEFEAIARACGRNPISIWSVSSKKHPMSREQLSAREYILENEAIPEEYDLFILNASCETAINIRSHMDFFIVHNSNDTHIKQARGRYRGDLDTLYLLDKEHGIIDVPEDFLNRPLFKEDKQALREALGIKNDKGRLIPWERLSQRLTDCGYSVAEGRRIENRPNVIITKL